MPHLRSIVIFCRDVYAMAPFWSTALDAPPVPEDAAALESRSLAVDESVLLRSEGHPDVWISPVGHLDRPGNRVHLDVAVTGDDVAHLLAAGATLVREERDWTVLADPEGNEFCAVHADR
jgi:Glyoxalase-like domain